MIIIAARMILIQARCRVEKSRNVQCAVGVRLDVKMTVPAK